jgi:hypothetical protein
MPENAEWPYVVANVADKDEHLNETGHLMTF